MNILKWVVFRTQIWSCLVICRIVLKTEWEPGRLSVCNLISCLLCKSSISELLQRSEKRTIRGMAFLIQSCILLFLERGRFSCSITSLIGLQINKQNHSPNALRLLQVIDKTKLSWFEEERQTPEIFSLTTGSSWVWTIGSYGAEGNRKQVELWSEQKEGTGTEIRVWARGDGPYCVRWPEALDADQN